MKHGLLLLLIFCGCLQALEFPIKSPFLATVAGTPPAEEYELRDIRVHEAILGLPDHTQRHADEIFWDVDKPRFKFAWQGGAAPLIFIIAGTGARFDASKMEFLKRVYYQAGYHVIQLSSPTSYDFIVSSSQSHKPGLSRVDAVDLYMLMQEALKRARAFRKLEVTSFQLTGYSLGALNAAFVAQLDEREKQFGFEKVLLINPPVNLKTAVDNLDRLLLADVPGVDDSSSLFRHFFDKLADYFRTHRSIDVDESMLFHLQKSGQALTDEELAVLIGVSFRFSVAAMYFTSDAMSGSGNLVPEGFRLKRTDSRTPYFRKAMHTGFEDYVSTVLLPFAKQYTPKKSTPELFQESSLYELGSWLKTARHVGVMHNADDLIIDQQGLTFLYETFQSRASIWPRGGHMGNLEYSVHVESMLAFMKGKGFPQPVSKPLAYTHPLQSLKLNDETEELLGQWSRGMDQLQFMAVYDPIESINRSIFRFNRQLDRYFLEPVIDLYEAITPSFVRLGVHHFFQNLKEVSNIFNSILQLNGEKTMKSAGRLLINTTLGVVGLFDPAASMGVPFQQNDFGMTLAHYGVGAGPYLVVPVLGPSSLRDISGLGVDLTVEDRVDFTGVPGKTFSDPEVFAIYGVNYRYTVPMSYDDFSSPFSYDLIRFLYTRKRELQLLAE